ncbi:hypothetical protein KM043_001118 [Ampulex compressa]|nr:hypothetical protein KM043_001118 [Ampulex compressa]
MFMKDRGSVPEVPEEEEEVGVWSKLEADSYLPLHPFDAPSESTRISSASLSRSEGIQENVPRSKEILENVSRSQRNQKNVSSILFIFNTIITTKYTHKLPSRFSVKTSSSIKARRRNSKDRGAPEIILQKSRSPRNDPQKIQELQKSSSKDPVVPEIILKNPGALEIILEKSSSPRNNPQSLEELHK